MIFTEAEKNKFLESREVNITFQRIELYEYCLKPSISAKINLDRSRGAFGTLY
jgi:hypothetical protein